MPTLLFYQSNALGRVVVSGRLLEVRGDLSQLLIEQLSTSIGVYKHAVIRMEDLVYADINFLE